MDTSTATESESQPFDFRQGGILSEKQSRLLRKRHEDLASALADRLTLWLRSDFSLRLARVGAVSYAGFIESLPAATHVTLFKLEPLRGICLLETPPPLAIAVVERLLGGPAQSLGETRDLTEVEIALFDQWSQILFEEWQLRFPEPPTPKIHLLGHESAPRFLQSAPPEMMMIEVVFDATFAEGNVPIQLAFPYPTLEPLLQHLAPSEEPAAPATAAMPSASPVPWNHGLDDMKLAVSAHWIGLELTARELATLQVGDVDRDALKPYNAKQISADEALDRAAKPIRGFMLKQARVKDVELFASMAGLPPTSPDQLPMKVVIPGFIISELRTAFQMGFLIFIPFILIDLVVATVLMSLGMMMMPPMTISLPLKILLFVLVDGWGLIIRSLV